MSNLIFTGTTGSGKEYRIVMRKVSDAMLSYKTYQVSLIGDIWIEGKPYPCAFRTYENRFIVNFYGEGAKAFGYPGKSLNMFIDRDFRIEYESYREERKKELALLASTTKIETVRITYRPTFRESEAWYLSTPEMDIEAFKMSEVYTMIMGLLPYVNTNNLEAFKTDADIGDYSIVTYYECPVSDLMESLGEAREEKQKEQEKEQAEKEAREEKEKAISNGCIYFTCESPIQDEEGKLMNAPTGIYTIDHRISKELFGEIAHYGNYYSNEILEEFDMFFHSPGWRFSFDAVKKLKGMGKMVFVDGKKV